MRSGKSFSIALYEHIERFLGCSRPNGAVVSVCLPGNKHRCQFLPGPPPQQAGAGNDDAAAPEHLFEGPVFDQFFSDFFPGGTILDD